MTSKWMGAWLLLLTLAPAVSAQIRLPDARSEEARLASFHHRRDSVINLFANQVAPLIWEKDVNKPIEFRIRRDGVEQTISITPYKEGEQTRVGMSPKDATRSYKPTPIEAVGMSIQRNYELAGLILNTLKDLFTGEASPKQLMGPIGIAQVSGEAARTDFIALLGLMASISLNLGLLNLLPIPVLDGGHIFIMAIETISRRDFSLQAKEKMLFVGFVLLMTLMVTVIYNDLTRVQWLGKLMPWR